MIISCENCSTSFKLDDSLLKSTGSKVRCSNCKNIFLVYPPSLTETHDTQEDIGELSAGPHGEPEDHTSGDGSNRQFDGAALAQSGDLSTEQVQGDEALPEKLLDMDEDTIAQILKLDETPQDIPDA